MLNDSNQPIVALATASGKGAVGIIRLSGLKLDGLVAALCGRELQPREATYLSFKDAKGEPIDKGLALFFPAPNSFTGEDVLEIQAHGGAVVLQLLLARCLEAAAEMGDHSNRPRLPGLRLARPGEFTQRAFLNNKIDLTQAEAVADLIDATTESAARSAMRSLTGAFSKEVNHLRDDLILLRMLVEATLDFPEEEIDFLVKADAKGKLLLLEQKLASVIKQTRQGTLLREGLRVVIAGQPNAGKSSLLNVLAGAELAIVTPIAGTTRDKVQETIQIEGVPIHVIDTAGLRNSAEEVERIGISRTWEAIEKADAVILLHDLTRMDSKEYLALDSEIHAQLIERLPKKIPVLNVWNKVDAVKDIKPPDGQVLSTKTGEGLETLRKSLLDVAGWQSNQEGVYIARTRHIQALHMVSSHLAKAAGFLATEGGALELLAEELRLSQNALNEITGEFTPDDLLGVIFSKFCIGK